MPMRNKMGSRGGGERNSGSFGSRGRGGVSKPGFQKNFRGGFRGRGGTQGRGGFQGRGGRGRGQDERKSFGGRYFENNDRDGSHHIEKDLNGSNSTLMMGKNKFQSKSLPSTPIDKMIGAKAHKRNAEDLEQKLSQSGKDSSKKRLMKNEMDNDFDEDMNAVTPSKRSKLNQQKIKGNLSSQGNRGKKYKQDEDEEDDIEDMDDDLSVGSESSISDDGLEDVDDSEDLEDEDEEPIIESQKKSKSFKTPLSLQKSAMKTPGTDKAMKKVVIASPDQAISASKTKTPVTPYPSKIRSAMDNGVPDKKLLKMSAKKFSVEEESDQEMSVDGEEEDEVLSGDQQSSEDDEGEEESEEEERDSEDEEMETSAHKLTKNEGEGKKAASIPGRTKEGKQQMKSEVIKTATTTQKIKNDSPKKQQMKVDVTKAGLASAKLKNDVQKKQNVKDDCSSNDAEKTQGTKRSAGDIPVKMAAVKRLRLEDAKDILEEEERRKSLREKCSLFVSGFHRNTKALDLKNLHPDIIGVRILPHRSFGWLVFASESSCEKAFDAVSEQKLKGEVFKVDYCGEKSKQSQKSPTKTTRYPINTLELYVTGFPSDATKEMIQLIFPSATGIVFPKNKGLKFCFVHFTEEADARAAFEKGRNLKIGGFPVDVFFGRLRKDEDSVDTKNVSKGKVSSASDKQKSSSKSAASTEVISKKSTHVSAEVASKKLAKASTDVVGVKKSGVFQENVKMKKTNAVDDGINKSASKLVRMATKKGNMGKVEIDEEDEEESAGQDGSDSEAGDSDMQSSDEDEENDDEEEDGDEDEESDD